MRNPQRRYYNRFSICHSFTVLNILLLFINTIARTGINRQRFVPFKQFVLNKIKKIKINNRRPTPLRVTTVSKSITTQTTEFFKAIVRPKNNA